MILTKSKAGQTEYEKPNKIKFGALQTDILLNALTKVPDILRETRMNGEKLWMFGEILVNCLPEA